MLMNQYAAADRVVSSDLLQAVPVMCFRRWMFAWSVRKPVFARMATWSLPECFVPVTAVGTKMPVRY